jgi:hypothetical protein
VVSNHLWRVRSTCQAWHPQKPTSWRWPGPPLAAILRRARKRGIRGASLIPIAQAYFQFSVPLFTEQVLEEYAKTLFQALDETADRLLPLPDYGLHLDIEEGSIKGKALVLATVVALYHGIGTFGSFVQGLREINALARTVGDELIHDAIRRSPVQSPPLTWSRRDSATLGRLLNLFREVERGERDPQSATQEALDLFGDQEEVPAEFARDLEAAIRTIRQDPKQLDLPFSEILTPAEIPGEPSEPKQRPAGGSKVALTPRRRVRVEVWRDGKDGEVLVRVVPL